MPRELSRLRVEVESVRAFHLATSSPVSSCSVLPKAQSIDIFFYTGNLLGLYRLGCFGKEPVQQSSNQPRLSLCNVLSHLAELCWDTSIASSCILLLFCFPISPGRNPWELRVPHSAPIQAPGDGGPVSASRGSYSCFALRDTIGLIG